MKAEQMAAIEQAARAMLEYDEKGDVAGWEEDAIQSTWDQVVTPQAVLDLVKLARGEQLTGLEVRGG